MVKWHSEWLHLEYENCTNGSNPIFPSALTDGRQARSVYLPLQDKILFWDGKNLGLRGVYNGVLLLDTVLQSPVVHRDDLVRIELLLSEAMLLLYSLQSLEETGLENTTDAVNELMVRISEAQANTKKGIKAQKVGDN